MADTEDTQSNEPGLSMAAKKHARKKNRPTYSCLNCHKRKVKCDRVKPCGACCLRGAPSECEYGGSKQDRHYIEQSTLIENLLQTCDTLKEQLEDTRRQANLPMIKHEDVNSPASSGASRSSGEEEPEEQQKGDKEESPDVSKAKLGSSISGRTGMSSFAGSSA